MRPNAIKEKWRQGQPAIGGWCAIPSSFSAEIMAHQGFDWVCIDTQHGAIDYTTALPMLQAISTTDSVPFVRVPWNEPSIIMKYLDAGAYGLIVPMIETRADAEAAVRAARYAPHGIRSFGPIRANLYAGPGYAQESNDEIALCVMIETPKALENLDEIASVEGIDVLYIGPGDLSQALGLGQPYNADNPKHAEAVTHIREVTERHGKIPGIHTSGSTLTTRYLREGFKMILLTSDNAGVVSGATRELGIAREVQTEIYAGKADA